MLLPVTLVEGQHRKASSEDWQSATVIAARGEPSRCFSGGARADLEAVFCPDAFSPPSPPWPEPPALPWVDTEPAALGWALLGLSSALG